MCVPIQYNNTQKKKKMLKKKNAIHIQDRSNYQSHQLPT